MIRIKTENLLIRSVSPEDAEEVSGMWKLGNERISEDEAREVIHTMAENRRKNSPGHIFHLCLAVFRDKHIIGWCGLDGTRDNIINIFYLILETERNKGYASECAAALLDYGFNEMKLECIHGRCYKDNIASQKVLEKCGMDSPADEGDSLHYVMHKNNYTGRK